jgi:hypothetical protein
MAGPGGARPGGGRPPGSKNKTPSRSLQAQQRFAELVYPQLEAYFKVLDSIAKDKKNRPIDRIAAVKELLDRSLGRPKEIVEISTPDEGATVEEVLGMWDAAGAPPDDDG